MLRPNETPVEPYWATEPPLSFFRDDTFKKYDRNTGKISYGRRLKYKRRDKTFVGSIKTDELKLANDDVNLYISEL